MRHPKFSGADTAMLRESYHQVNRSSGNSVRAAWRFGQTLDSFSDAYTLLDLANMVGVSYGTVHKYRKFYGAFQRPELALELAEEIESWDIGLLLKAVEDGDVPVRRAMAGRRFRSTCRSCGSHDVAREEFDPDTEEAVVSALMPLFVPMGASRAA